MILKKSPGGSIYPYYYKGGELLGLHWGSFGSDDDALIARMKAEEVFFIEQNQAILLWIDFYQTKLTGRVVAEFIDILKHIHARIPRLGLVGCSALDRFRIKRIMKGTASLLTLPVKYFNDPEEAKTWLVSEPG